MSRKTEPGLGLPRRQLRFVAPPSLGAGHGAARRLEARHAGRELFRVGRVESCGAGVGGRAALADGLLPLFRRVVLRAVFHRALVPLCWFAPRAKRTA